MKRYLLLSGLLVLMMLLPITLTANDNTDIETQNKEVVTRLIEEVWNWDGEDLDELKAISGELFAFIFISHAPTTLDEPIKSLTSAWVENKFLRVHNAFPDLQLTIENMVADGDLVVVHYSAQGTFDHFLERMFFDVPTDSFQLIQPTGEVETWDGMFMFRLEDAKIVEEYWYFDRTWLSIMHHSLDLDLNS